MRAIAAGMVLAVAFMVACSGDSTTASALDPVILAGSAYGSDGRPQAGWDAVAFGFAPPCSPRIEGGDTLAFATTRDDGSFILEMTLPRGAESCVNVVLGTSSTAGAAGAPSRERTRYLHSSWRCVPPEPCRKASVTISIPRPVG